MALAHQPGIRLLAVRIMRLLRMSPGRDAAGRELRRAHLQAERQARVERRNRAERIERRKKRAKIQAEEKNEKLVVDDARAYRERVERRNKENRVKNRSKAKIRSQISGQNVFLKNFDGFAKGEFPNKVLNYPSMMSPAEKAMLYWLAKTVYTGQGVIVDGGVFVGASTNAFCLGLRENDGARKKPSAPLQPVRSYELAIWHRSFSRYLGKPGFKQLVGETAPDAGTSYAGLLKDILSHHSDINALNIGDIAAIAHDGSPVEIAFYDCLKNSELERAVFEKFAPFYIPGRTVVIHQDFFFEGAPAIKVRQEWMSGYFDYMGQISTSAYFRLKKPLPREVLDFQPSRNLSLAEQTDLILQAAKRSEFAHHGWNTRLSAVQLALDNDDVPTARRIMRAIRRDLAESGAQDKATDRFYRTAWRLSSIMDAKERADGGSDEK